MTIRMYDKLNENNGKRIIVRSIDQASEPCEPSNDCMLYSDRIQCRIGQASRGGGAVGRMSLEAERSHKTHIVVFFICMGFRGIKLGIPKRLYFACKQEAEIIFIIASLKIYGETYTVF